MADWLAIGPDQGQMRACRVSGSVLLEQGLFSGLEAAQAAYPGDLATIDIGTGAPDTVPCPVVPEHGHGVPPATQSAPPAVLGGWTRLRVSGVLRARPNWDGVIVEVGTESHIWIHVSASEVVSLQGIATPRLVSALSGAESAAPEAIDMTLSRPERLASHLYGAEVTGDAQAVTGHLVGAEIAATKPYWLGQEVVVLAQGHALSSALGLQGADTVDADPDAALAAGLAALAERAGLAG